MPRPTCTVLLAASILLSTGAATANAQAPATPTVSALGSATITPKPANPKSNASIAAAVKAAQTAVLPKAEDVAKERAKLLAQQDGLVLGAFLSVAEQGPSPFGGFYGVDGTFGPGRYCGNVTRYRTTRLANGSVRRTRIGTRRQCRIPRISTTVSVTFQTTPA